MTETDLPNTNKSW